MIKKVVDVAVQIILGIVGGISLYVVVRWIEKKREVRMN